MSRANSANACRQMPQGGAGRPPPTTTTHATGSRWPAATMATSADLSAQTVAPNVAFSTLQPAKTRPCLVTMAAPT